MSKRFLLIIGLFGMGVVGYGQEKVISLYNGAAPGSENWNWEEKVSDKNMFGTKVVYNVTHPTLTVFEPAPGTANGTAVIICPGGGFHNLSIDREGNEVAKWLNQKGVTAFVLKYRVVRSFTDDPVKEMMTSMGKKEFDSANQAVIPLAIADGKAALTYVRAHAEALGLTHIGIIGFSAGGTIAAATAYGYTKENRPDFVAPIYGFLPPAMFTTIPVYAPPMFVAAASDDFLGLAPHSVWIYTQWITAKHSAELHMYVKGGHGFGMKKQNLPSDTWIDRFGDWLGFQGFLTKK